MHYIVSAMFVVVGAIHLLPLAGALSNQRAAKLYDVALVEPNIEILMRHRAVMFGILGGLFIFAAFSPAVQIFAFAAGFVSVISFLLLAKSVGGYNAKVGRVFTADVIALICLVVGLAAYGYGRMGD